MLASNVAVIGKFDPKRATLNAAPAVSGEEFTVEELDSLIGTAEASGSAAKKGGKRRKV